MTTVFESRKSADGIVNMKEVVSPNFAGFVCGGSGVREMERAPPEFPRVNDPETLTVVTSVNATRT